MITQCWQSAYTYIGAKYAIFHSFFKTMSKHTFIKKFKRQLVNTY